MERAAAASNLTGLINATAGNSTAGMMASLRIGSLHKRLPLSSFKRQGTRRHHTASASCSLVVDWAALGLSPRHASAYAPRIPSWQGAHVLPIGHTGDVGPVPVVSQRGLLVIISDAASSKVGVHPLAAAGNESTSDLEAMRVHGSLVR